MSIQDLAIEVLEAEIQKLTKEFLEKEKANLAQLQRRKVDKKTEQLIINSKKRIIELEKNINNANNT